MKQLIVDFYSTYNLGDDLFVDILTELFSDCRIDLLSGIRHIPRNMRPNVRLHPYSYVEAIGRNLQNRVGKDTAISKIIGGFVAHQREKPLDKYDAYVQIGGSLFMQNGLPEEEIDFSAGVKPEFDYVSRQQTSGNRFLIGANLGPVYSDAYWADIRRQFMNFRHVCLRDYSSYRMLRDLPHIQYAPDVIFLAPQPDAEDRGENVVISVIDIRSRTKDPAIAEAYWSLLRDTILAFNARKIPVTLASFCKVEGDETAIEHLRRMLPADADVSVYLYNGNIREMLTLLSGATYVVASRFHAMILALSFGKSVFPISYNCKIKHYLEDVDFQGRYATLADLPQTTCEDVLYNYDHRIITDCSRHKEYARNQFRALREYLDR